ncbi:MAG: N-acetylmuramoyl-L-alanine amidase [Alphaproteobacteria bacterium]
MRLLLAIFTLLPLLFSSPTRAEILRAEIRLAPDKERVILFSNQALSHKRIFFLEKPVRLVIDFPSVKARNLKLPEDYQGKFITQVRFGQFNKSLSRLVLEVKQPVRVLGSYSVPPSGGTKQWQYVLDLASDKAVSPPLRPVATQTSVPPPIVRDEKTKPLIVIDAGHGGQDPGAIGANRTLEKDVTLAYAKALRAALLKTGRYRVALTREDDRFIMLADRVSMARRLEADMFISLHADSNPRREARGFSVYSLSETASDAESAALAEQENKVDILGGMEVDVDDPEVADILIDLTQRETMSKSGDLAEILVGAMHPKVTQLSKTHRYAGFRVLKAPDIPSVLIEIGFLSNPIDERLLASPEFRELVVASLIKGIDRYFEKKGG